MFHQESIRLIVCQSSASFVCILDEYFCVRSENFPGVAPGHPREHHNYWKLIMAPLFTVGPACWRGLMSRTASQAVDTAKGGGERGQSLEKKVSLSLIHSHKNTKLCTDSKPKCFMGKKCGEISEMQCVCIKTVSSVYLTETQEYSEHCVEG